MPQLPSKLTSTFNALRSWWEHRVLFEPKDWIQVEVTSRCNAACVYCPRTVYGASWRNSTLSMELFGRLLPAFGKAGLVHLQGWGEPLLHPELPAMIAAAKSAGARVGTTTNGMLLDARRAEALVSAGLDILAFSLVGTSAGYNDRIRAGTRIETILENIATLERIKRRYRCATPEVHVAYLLPATGVEEIKNLPLILEGRGVKEVVVSLLDFVPGEDGLADLCFDLRTEARRSVLKAIFAELQDKSRRIGLEIHPPAFRPGRQGYCLENVANSICIGASGDVSPCVLANIPVEGVNFSFNGGVQPYNRLTFGNIGRDMLPVIWRNPDYERWRAAHAAKEAPAPCRRCAKSFL